MSGPPTIDLLKEIGLLSQVVSDLHKQLSGQESLRKILAGEQLRIDRIRRQIETEDLRRSDQEISRPVQAEEERERLQNDLERLVAERTAASERAVERLKLEIDKREKTEKMLRGLVETAPDATLIIDREGVVVLASEQSKKLFGYEQSEIVGQPVEMLIPRRYRYTHPEQRRKFMDAPSHRAMGSGLELTGLCKDGREIPVEVSLCTIESEDGLLVVSAVRDISERKAAENEAREHREDLAHVTRLSTMAEMATGIAHEINQPLSAIITYSYAARQALESPSVGADEVRSILDRLEEHAGRAGDIVKQVRSLVIKSRSEHLPADLNSLVRKVIRFLDLDLRQGNVTLELSLDESSPIVLVDEIHIQQVVVNLMKNAIDAMEEIPDENRRLTLATRISPDGKAEVEVSDCGKGFSDKDSTRIFDAFFSTKVNGMGMGLAISRSIVEQHEGKIWVEKNANGGATFLFTLPRSGKNGDSA